MNVVATKRTVYGQEEPKPCRAQLRLVPKPLPENASLGMKLWRLKAEVANWGRAGFPMVPKAVRTERLALCKACEFYDAKGNMGLGLCGAPGCGCTRVKLALATSRCPYPGNPKWLPYVAPIDGSVPHSPA